MVDLIQRLGGTTDRPPQEWRRLIAVQHKAQRFFAQRGYQVIDTPTLEHTELFLRKSGGELAARMYSFTDPSGRRISLRPEFTSSVVRAYVEGHFTGELPLRVQYCGPVFRYESGQHAARESMQLGAEIIGANSITADAEVMAFAMQGLSHLGIRGHSLRVGHLGIVNSMLEELKLSERVRVFLLGNLHELAKGGEAAADVRQLAVDLGLLRTRGPRELTKLVQRLESKDAEEMVEGFLAEAVTGPTGQRTPEEVFLRFLKKLREQEDPAQVQRALDFAAALAGVTGEPDAALNKLSALLRQYHLEQSLLQPLRDVLSAVHAYDLHGTPITVDLAMARGFAYYTGAVFELEHVTTRRVTSLGGGGRYNGLVKALGGKRDAPALGFAYALDPILAMLPKQQGDAADELPVVLVLPNGGNGAAVSVIEKLRNQGIAAELEVTGRDEAEALVYARKRGIKKVVMVHPDGSTVERPV